jgi:hypothetical protein
VISPATQPLNELKIEFDRQVGVLVERGYPAAAGMRPLDFIDNIGRLADLLPAVVERPGGRVEFVVVVTADLVPRARAIELVERHGETGFSVMDEPDLARFDPIDGVALPNGLAYLVTDVDLGGDSMNVTPEVAVDRIHAHGRSPLTIDEGIALVTQYPEAVAPGAGFSLAGSRCGDRRVTALWISDGKPKLGWCWAGNPHSWLGTASCDARAGRADRA